ncbi:MAG: hypothetical protein HYX57_10600 [Chloroflexi bacterium]|nr:hypothetical protein [Chloroflexota bacterium]
MALPTLVCRPTGRFSVSRFDRRRHPWLYRPIRHRPYRGESPPHRPIVVIEPGGGPAARAGATAEGQATAEDRR